MTAHPLYLDFSNYGDIKSVIIEPDHVSPLRHFVLTRIVRSAAIDRREDVDA